MDEKDDFPISGTDEVTVSGGVAAGRPRTLGEFKPTNVPLSAADIKHRRNDPANKQNQGWVSRNTGNIGELTPLPDTDTAEQ